jgi:hypothetical protein
MFIYLENADFDFIGRDIGNFHHEPTFEYGRPNPPNFKYLEENFPKREEVLVLAEYYLMCNFFILNKILIEDEFKFLNDYEYAKKIFANNGGSLKCLERESASLVKQILEGELIWDWHWTIWAVNMSSQR